MNIINQIRNKALVKFSRGPLKDSWNDYLTWLSFANAGMLNRGNVDCFDYAIKNLPSTSPIIEIGSFCGLSTNIISYFKQKYKVNNSTISCDKWIFEGSENGGMLGDSKFISHANYHDYIKETFIRNVKMFSDMDLPFTLEVFSDEFFDFWKNQRIYRDVFDREIQLGGSISFCYIDGNHSYEFSKRDFENCDKYLDKGGFILFDDSADGSGWEVCKVVQEVRATKRYELVAKAPNYFFRKMEHQNNKAKM
jgi:hypothetical protein